MEENDAMSILGSLLGTDSADAANKAKNAYAEAKKRTAAAVLFAAEHYARTRNLEMNFTVPREDPEE